MKYQNIREEELKNKVAQDYFWLYDCTKIIGNVDFCVCMYQSQKGLFEQESLLWAEAKKGSSDIYNSIVQLILTIGKARTYDKFLPPAFLGAFDGEKIAFIPYNDIHEVFYLNDFNWNVTPSNHETKEFKLIHQKVKAVIDNKALLFNFLNDDRELKKFIKQNFVVGKFGVTKTKIDKNNFMVIYNKWLQAVKPTIAVNWDIARQQGIIDGDFYLADLLSQENNTLKEKLFVLLRHDHYVLDRKIDEAGMFSSKRTDFTDKQVAHTQFWNKYERPPREEYWDYMVERRDLLVPQDVRERKGSFFTPQIWVELSQKYLADVLGENWQDEYYVWDCAAGTGNLLNGLTNKYNIWASTLDKQDVEVMHDRVNNGANLLHDHVFQFDFLNDEFIPKSKGGKLPDSLFKIISNEEKRKKLVIYINPPYAEATTAKTVTKTGKNKSGVAIENKTNQRLKEKIGNASNEIFALFMAQVYDKMPDCILAQFSKLKFINGSNFKKFKEYFLAHYLKGFVVPADSFDNVKGKFPIGFTIWDTSIKKRISKIATDVYEKNLNYLGEKNFYGDLPCSINKWIVKFDNKKENGIGYLCNPSPDFQHNNQLYISLKKGIEHFNFWNFTNKNIFYGCIYFSVRHCIESSWLNDRDQFLYPNDGWKTDTEFQNDCLAFTLFHGQNRISSKDGVNHWIPFTEQEVNARENFESNFMTDFIKGKIKPKQEIDLFTPAKNSPSLRGLGGVTIQYLKSQNIPTDNLIFSKDFLPYNPNLKTLSRNLRKAGNLSEVLLWKELRADRFHGYSFYRQKPILNYVVDFYCKELNLVIEIDGSSHHSEEAMTNDKERDRQLNAIGLTVLRVRDEDVKKNLGNMLREIELVIEKLETPPDPLKEGELVFSAEAKAVFDAGREVWKYYHQQLHCNVNASLYDIKEHFQGRNEKGKMNNKSKDENYNRLMGNLRETLIELAEKIAPKGYAYEFLKQ